MQASLLLVLHELLDWEQQLFPNCEMSSQLFIILLFVNNVIIGCHILQYHHGLVATKICNSQFVTNLDATHKNIHYSAFVIVKMQGLISIQRVTVHLMFRHIWDVFKCYLVSELYRTGISLGKPQPLKKLNHVNKV